MPIFRESGGVFASVKQLSINDNGIVKRVTAAWINDGGVFKKLFPTELVDMDKSAIFDTSASEIKWIVGGNTAGRYWSLVITIPARPGVSLPLTASSRVIITRDGQPQQIRFFDGGMSPDGIADNAVSRPPNDAGKIRLAWQWEFKTIEIPYNPSMVGSVTNIRIELADVAGGSYFYDTTAMLIAF